MYTSPTTTLWFYFKSASPVHTCTLPAHDARLPYVLDDVRLVRHGNHVFIHLRSQFEWERAIHYLGDSKAATISPSTAA